MSTSTAPPTPLWSAEALDKITGRTGKALEEIDDLVSALLRGPISFRLPNSGC